MAIKYIDVKQELLSDNSNLAEELREKLKTSQTFMINVMSSPGAGKTTLLLETIRRLKDELRIGVIEGDIESMVDAEKITKSGAVAVQIRTGGDCHLDAPMLKPALDTMDLDQTDVIFVENIGNLVCPAEFDIGAAARVMLLSVPEGDDKVLKYPLMFTVCDLLLVTKTDCQSLFDFHMEELKKRVHQINPRMEMIPICSKTGENMNAWVDWLRQHREAFLAG
jgi:hydrogenase nickel incorporation protein HypB